MWEWADVLSSLGTLVGVAALAWLGFRLIVERGRPEGGDEQVTCDDECRVCGYDLRASSIRCPECGTAIVRGEAARAMKRGDLLDPKLLRECWPADPIKPRSPQPHESFVRVHSTRNSVEAGMLIEHLTVRGIIARRELKEISPLRGSKPYIEVIVPEDDEVLAREVIDRFRCEPVDKRHASAD